MLPRLLFSILVWQSLNAGAQSVFTFQYQLPGDTVRYHSFFLRNDDGSGLFRIRFNPQNGRDDIVIEAYPEEQTPLLPSGEPDTARLLISPVGLQAIQSDGQPLPDLPVFIFRLNPLSGFFEPAGLQARKTGKELDILSSFQWQLEEYATLKKELVGQYFSEDDDFYQNLFRPLTKGLTPAEKKIRMHLLIVADTLDKKIGKASLLDMEKIRGTLQSVCDFLGIRLLTDIVFGKSYGKPGVQAALNRLRLATRGNPNDIIVFYYTGHGFRNPGKPRKFPHIKLKNFIVPRPDRFKTTRDSLVWIKKERDANLINSMNIEDIYRNILKMGARMNLVIADCCNDDIFSVPVEALRPASTKGSGIEWDEKNIRSLFLNSTPLSILVGAAKEGQKAASKKGFGAIYTDYLKKSLENHCSKLRTNITWDLVLRQAALQTTARVKDSYCGSPRTPENVCRQEPVFQVKIGR